MRVEFYTHLPAYEMEHTECSETSVYKIQTPGNHPKESTQNLRVAAQCQPIRHFTTEVQYVQCSMCSTVCAVQYVQYSMCSTVQSAQPSRMSPAVTHSVSLIALLCLNS